MSQAVTLNGTGFTIPDVGENDWGQNVTDFLVAIPGAVLQKSGGTFTLTAETDFGVTYGLKSAYYKSRAANPASAGAVRLGVADVVSWRNNANGANLDLGVDAADALTFGSNKVLTVAGGFTTVATNSFANQKGIRFMEQTGNGTNYMEIVAPDAVTANVTLKLPDGAGTAGQVLSTDGAGVMSWINAAGGGTINSGVQGRLAVYPSNGTTIDDTVTMTNVVSVAIAAHGQTSAYTIPDTGQATANFVMTEGTQSIAGAKTFSGVLVFSNNSTAALTISQASTLKIDSTNALVSIGTTTMTYPLYISKSSAGATITMAIENTEAANGASHARLYVITGGASGGDPYINLYNGVANYSIGMDNSDSDALCITAASTLNGTNLFRMTTAGAITTVGALTITPVSNQIVLGTTNTATISASAPSASRVYTISDPGGSASFVMTEGAQTVNGVKTFADGTNVTGNQDSNVDFNIINAASSANAGAVLSIQCEAGGFDPKISFGLGGGGDDYCIGIDNSDSDKFKMAVSQVELSTNTFFVATIAGEVTLPLQPMFQARIGSAQTDVTGNGTAYTVVFNTEIVDRNADFDGTSTFTAPVTGLYAFRVCLRLRGIDATSTSATLALVTTLRTYNRTYAHSAGIFGSTTVGMVEATWFCVDMTAGNTAILRITVSGMAGNTVDLSATDGDENQFMGFLQG